MIIAAKCLKLIATLYSKVIWWMTLIGGIIVLVLCLYTTGDVTGRYTMNSPLPASFELTIIFMVFIVFWGLAQVQARGGHMRLDFLRSRFSPRGRSILDMLSLIIGLFLFSLITWQAWSWFMEAWLTNERMSGIWDIPYAPARLAYTIGAFFLCIQ